MTPSTAESELTSYRMIVSSVLLGCTLLASPSCERDIGGKYEV